MMILYFTGTGNSRYIACELAIHLHQEMIDLNEYIKNKKMLSIGSQETLIFVTPTYGWQLPHIIIELIEKSKFHNNLVYFVLTCGEDIGHARATIEKLCLEKSLCLKGVLEVVMPENYIAMFKVENEDITQHIIDKAVENLKVYVPYFQEKKDLPNKNITIIDRLKSSVVNKIFYKYFVKAKLFYATDQCVSCGLCEENCVLNNIKIANGKPVWSTNCTHCMACICKCPKEAIEYGKKSIGKRRYQCIEHK